MRLKYKWSFSLPCFRFPLPDASNAVLCKAIKDHLPPATLTTTAETSQIGVNLDRRHSTHPPHTLQSHLGVNWTLTRSHSWSIERWLGVNSWSIELDSESIHGQLNIDSESIMVNWIHSVDSRLQVKFPSDFSQFEQSTYVNSRQHPVNSRQHPSIPVNIRSLEQSFRLKSVKQPKREGEGRLTLVMTRGREEEWWSTILGLPERRDYHRKLINDSFLWLF